MGNEYGRLIRNICCDGLGTLLEEDFASNKATKPSTVSVAQKNKKYPLRERGATVDISFSAKNDGPGYAQNVAITLTSDESVVIPSPAVYLGRVAPGQELSLVVPASVHEPAPAAVVIVAAHWENFDGSERDGDWLLDLESQREGIDWAALEASDPYSLEPVENASELVGRRELLRTLVSRCASATCGSTIIKGQKRVGKTSLAKAVVSRLRDEGAMTIYLEGGDYVHPTAVATVTELGNKVCKAIRREDPRLAGLPIPDFADALAPLSDFVDDVSVLTDNRRLIIVLDEFDSLPFELFTRDAFGDAFFLTLRSVSNRKQVGFIIVGGEKMSHVIEHQGEKLNKWATADVDYFGSNDLADFQELVEKPVSQSFEFSPEAIHALFSLTAGNPFFTKLVCRRIFATAVAKRDGYITDTEIAAASKLVVAESDVRAFQHFWEDGIFEVGGRRTDKSLRRRKVLVALSDALAGSLSASLGQVATNHVLRGLAGVEAEVREFAARNILIEADTPGTFDFKVPLFRQWLSDRGIQDLIAASGDMDAATEERLRLEAIRVKPAEVQALSSRLGHYRGQEITPTAILSWIGQFGVQKPEEEEVYKDQRCMFNLLQELRFYPDSLLRERMQQVDLIVRQGLTRKIEARRKKQADVVVSYFDGVADSGAELARMYADVGSIYSDNVVEREALLKYLAKTDEARVLLYLDDFVGSGEQLSDYLREPGTKEVIRWAADDRRLRVVYIAMVADFSGWAAVERLVAREGLPIELHALEVLDAASRPFEGKLGAFSDQDERRRAKELAGYFGARLLKKHPLGVGDLGLAVVFERGCPNNTLPVLWAEGSEWHPLFKRL